jgi:hypothetical protein
MDQQKNCTNCSRGLQPLSEFVGRRGEPCRTCKKCREKGKRNDNKPERKEYHAELAAEKGAIYNKACREKKKNGSTEKTHDMNQTCVWVKNEKSRDRTSEWKKKNLNERLGHAKRSALTRGHDWYLADEFAKHLMTQQCHYCGFLNLEIRCNGIDRMDNEICYIPSNCVSCCKDCNYAKHTMGYNSFIRLCHTIAGRISFPTQSGTDTQHQEHHLEESGSSHHCQ